MATFVDLKNLESTLAAQCPLFEVNLISTFFMLTDYFPTVITLVMLGISLYETDLYLFITSIAVTLDIVANSLLRLIVGASNRFPGCGALHQMPSLSSDLGVFLVTVFLTFCFLWKPRTSELRIVLLNVGLLLVLVSRVYIGINTTLELFVGSLTGFFWALVFQAFVYFVLVPWLDYIVQTQIAINLSLRNILLKDAKVRTQ